MGPGPVKNGTRVGPGGTRCEKNGTRCYKNWELGGPGARKKKEPFWDAVQEKWDPDGQVTGAEENPAPRCVVVLYRDSTRSALWKFAEFAIS